MNDIERENDLNSENDESWKTSSMEYDLLTNDWILTKVRESDIYAQNLYAAICNNDFRKNEVFPILREERWSASWRAAGGIIANMQQRGDYLDWYCADISIDGYLSEGEVAPIIREDLLKLGWLVLDHK
jgi:hypothetical protein